MKRLMRVVAAVSMALIFTLSSLTFVHAGQENTTTAMDALESMGIYVDFGAGESRDAEYVVPNLMLINESQHVDEAVIVTLLDAIDELVSIGFYINHIDDCLLYVLVANDLLDTFLAMYFERTAENNSDGTREFQGIQPASTSDFNVLARANGQGRYPNNFRPGVLIWNARHDHGDAGNNLFFRIRCQFHHFPQPPIFERRLTAPGTGGVFTIHGTTNMVGVFVSNYNNRDLSVRLTLQHIPEW